MNTFRTYLEERISGYKTAKEKYILQAIENSEDKDHKMWLDSMATFTWQRQVDHEKILAEYDKQECDPDLKAQAEMLSRIWQVVKQSGAPFDVMKALEKENSRLTASSYSYSMHLVVEPEDVTKYDAESGRI